MKFPLLTVLGLWIAAPALLAAEVKFTAPPRVERSGERFQISFAVNEATDVEVAIVNAKGQVVRHLAAGVLGGKNPPPPPLKPGLTQQLTWDGKDDSDQPAVGGPFQARVRAGTSVRLGRMIGGSPYTGGVVSMPYRAPVNGLVVDAEGNLFVKLMASIGSHGNSGMWPWHLRKLDRQGNYLQTLLPYPPSTRPAQASGFNLLATPDGRFTPVNRTSLYPVFTVLGNEIVSRLAPASLPGTAATGAGKGDKRWITFVHTEARQLNFLAIDGSNALRSFPMWSDKSKLKCPHWLDIQVALSPDGRFAYYSNVAGTAYDGKQPSDIDPNWPQGRIYRQDLTVADSDPQPFFDLKLPDWDKEKYWMPSAWDKKTAAAGIDTDAKGQVLVCDLVNQQVVEISPAGKLLSATKVPWPDKVLVAHKTGDLYVIARKVSRGHLPPATLYKITGRGEKAKVAAELPLKGTVGGAATLDESGEVPVLWLSGKESEGDGERGREKLLRVEDRGAKLVVTGDQFLNRDEKAISFVGYMDVDREAELVYVTGSTDAVWRFHGETGEGGLLPIKAVDLAIGPGGTIYTWGNGRYEGPIARFDRDLKPAPLAATGKHAFGYLYGRAGRGMSVCGMDVDAQGRVYATYGSNDCHVRVYDAKGELVDFPRKQKSIEGKPGDVPAAITGVTGYGGSLRVDRQGNIYLLQAGLPKDYAPPAGYEKDEAFRQAVGSIWKFPPTGGEAQEKGGVVQSPTGALARYAGCGPVSRWNAVGACACTKPRFDVDDYGRLYIPNGITYTVSMRDNADNEIVRFGGYGNFDTQGPDSKEPRPEVPLGWPVTASATDKYIYVGDCLNHRIVRVDRQYAAQATLPLPEK